MSVLALSSCSSSEESATKAAQVLAQAKAATGGDAWDRIRIVHEQGQVIASSGEISDYEHWGDLHTLSVRNSRPSRPSYMVFDGNAAYACADAECASRSSLDARGVKIGAYMVSYGYFFPDRFAASFRYRGTREDGGVHYDIVDVVPEGLDTLEIWVNQETHYVSRLVLAGGAMRTDLSDYRQVGGVRLPFLARESGMTMKTVAVRFDPADAGAIAFSPPATP